MKNNKHTYIYSGPVMLFDMTILDFWTSDTEAVSEAKARSNLLYRFKRQYGYEPTAKISLPGKFVMTH